ncbi:MAG: hypothetical protein J0H43_16360, partial [Actinobacteria bacterium]|nr:hypothetical protein [Actinomycetota bacterium]
PRLVVVVDEFATLSEELPDFVPGLVTIARRGRSLGLHLVLATQRPSSVVSPEIRANVTLRIALRVTDPADSRDVIDSDAAAFIEHAAAGRGYLRRGTDLTAFQAAHVSSVTSSDPEKIRVELLQPWRRRPSHRTDGPGDLAVLVGLIGRTAAQERHVPVPAPWHPPLPETVPRHSLAEPAEPASVTLGLVDRPDHQERVPWTVDLARGTSLLVAGAGRSGRTTSLASLALGAASRLGPDQLALYIVDARGTLAEALAGLPHCATVLGPQDLALTPRLLQRLGSVADKPTDGVRHMLLLDDWPAVADSLTDTTASDAAHALAGLLRAGPSIGLTVAVTGDRSVLLPRFASSFSTRLLLRLADRLDYGVAGIAARDVPATLSAGRGIRPDGGDLVQVADPGPFDQAVATAEARWAGTLGRPAHAVYLAPLPERISVSDVAALPGRLVVGVGGDVGAPITVAPFDDADRLLVAGPPRSGRTTLLRLLLDQALTERLDVIVAAPERSELRARADAAGIPCLSPSDNAP